MDAPVFRPVVYLLSPWKSEPAVKECAGSRDLLQGTELLTRGKAAEGPALPPDP